MRRSTLAITTGVALAAALGVGVAWRLGSASDRGSDERGRGDASASNALQDAGAGTARDAPGVTGPITAPARHAAFDTTEGRAALAAQAERARFEKSIRDFLANAAALDAAERARIAAELDAQVEAEELARRMSADEARMLRLALLDRGVADETERLRRAEALAAAYRREAERRQRAFEMQQANDPRFIAYKSRESQVVAEVMAMPRIPGGLSRDEYLRLRLQAERERAWGRPGG